MKNFNTRSLIIYAPLVCGATLLTYLIADDLNDDSGKTSITDPQFSPQPFVRQETTAIVTDEETPIWNNAPPLQAVAISDETIFNESYRNDDNTNATNTPSQTSIDESMDEQPPIAALEPVDDTLLPRIEQQLYSQLPEERQQAIIQLNEYASTYGDQTGQVRALLRASLSDNIPQISRSARALLNRLDTL